MFETEDRKTGERGGSLLSLGRAIEEERAKQRIAEPAPLHPDAAERHQKARSRRESRPSPILDELTKAPIQKPGPASDVASRPSGDPATAPEPSLLRRLWRGDTSRPKTEASVRDVPVKAAATTVQSPVRQPAQDMARASSHISRAGQAPMSDTVVVVDRDEDDWRPLIDPARVIGGITGSKGLIVATTLLGALIGAGIAITTPKKYEAYAEIEVDPRNLKMVGQELTDVAGLPSDATLAIIENQVRVLTSSTVLNKVVDNENLKLEEDAEFNGSEGLDLNPINIIRSLLTRSDGTASSDRRRGLTIQKLAENIHVERTGKTFTILVGATAQSPKKAALIANTMVEAFIDTANRRQSDTAGRATKELTGKLAEMRGNVEAAERKVEQFKAENDIIDAQGRLITDDEIVKLNDQLSIAKARSLELNARAQSAKNLSTNDVLNGASPEAAASGVLTELRTQYASAKQEAERLSVRLGPRHPQYQAAQAQLEGAREQISVELRRINAQVQTELRRAVNLEQELAARLAQLKVRQGNLSSEMVTLRELEREASTQRSVYEAFLLRARETGEQKDISTVNISKISEAQPPLEASGASRAVITGVGGFLGLLAGLGIGGARGALESLRESSPTRRRRTAAVRKSIRPDVDPPVSSPAVAKPQAKSAPAVSKPVPAAARPVETPNAPPPAASQAPAKESPMNAPYVPPGYYPQQTPANGQPIAPQPVYVQPPQAGFAQQPYPPAPHSYAPSPQGYAPQHPAHAQAGFVQPQPVYAQPDGYPQAFPHHQAWPQSPQAYYPQSPGPQAMPAQPAAYGPYAAPTYPPAYPQAPGHPAAGYYPQSTAPAQPLPANSDSQAVSGSLSEIRESIREFRDAVRELTESRSHRRYF